MSDDRHRLSVPGLIPPGFVQALTGDGLQGTVEADGKVHLADRDDPVLGFVDEPDIEPGTDVRVKRRGGTVYCTTAAARAERKRKREQQKRERADRQDRAREDAEQFWTRYDIPFKHDVAVKGRLSALSCGSWGSGVDKRTVIHLFVREAFSAGRLERDSDVYLCDNDAQFRFTEGVRHTDSDANEYVPEVTCKTCLNLMDRWERAGDHE